MNEVRCSTCEAVTEIGECYDCLLLGNVVMKDGRIPLKRRTLTHCRDGHLLSDENVYVRKRPDRPGTVSRICKICRIESERLRRVKANERA